MAKNPLGKGLKDLARPGDRKAVDRITKGDAIEDYWHDNYVNQTHCSICGNIGVIDSRYAKTASGLNVGRLNYCLCPNGRALRNVKADMVWIVERHYGR